jgi:hypothetical protein
VWEELGSHPIYAHQLGWEPSADPNYPFAWQPTVRTQKGGWPTWSNRLCPPSLNTQVPASSNNGPALVLFRAGQCMPRPGMGFLLHQRY